MKIDTNQIQNILEKLSPKQQNPAKPSANSDADVTLNTDYAPLIEQAAKITPSDDDDNVVKRAQQLLTSGQLDSPQNTRQAAENIINFGI